MTEASSIRTILVPLDGSETGERALPWAKAIAGDTVSIALLEVTPAASSVRTIGGQIIGTAETIQEGYRQMAQQQLDESLARWFDSNDKVSTRIATGDPGEQILAVAGEADADMIVMSSHGRGAIGRFVSGSVADRVVRHAPLPVMIVGPEGEIARNAKIERIVAPIDNSPLSLAALPVAARLSRQTGAPVTVVHAVAPTSDVTMTYPDVVGMVPPSAYNQAQEQVTVEAKDFVANAAATLTDRGIEAKGELYAGNPAETIMSALKPGDVIVLSSHARQGLARWVIGSTSTKLIRNGQAPVVVVTRESIERETPPQVETRG